MRQAFAGHACRTPDKRNLLPLTVTIHPGGVLQCVTPMRFRHSRACFGGTTDTLDHAKLVRTDPEHGGRWQGAVRAWALEAQSLPLPE